MFKGPEKDRRKNLDILRDRKASLALAPFKKDGAWPKVRSGRKHGTDYGQMSNHF